MIFNIQRCSNRDGYGLRTTVFFKGCPLNCAWCANPESQSFKKEIMEAESRCIGCMACLHECPAGAISTSGVPGSSVASASSGSSENSEAIGYPRIRRDLCRLCLRCTEVCYAESKHVVGDDISVDDLYCEIEKDRVFFSRSGGGVTFSGGEPLAQPDFLYEIAKKCHDSGIHVMLESCGYAAFDRFEKVLPYVDAMYFDVKHIDPEIHRAATGFDNRLILENLRSIADYGIQIIVRTPVIPGYTDSVSNIRGIAELIRAIPGIRDYELLAYHDLGESKYRALGRNYALGGAETPSKERMFHLVDQANEVLEGSGKKCFYMP